MHAKAAASPDEEGPQVTASHAQQKANRERESLDHLFGALVLLADDMVNLAGAADTIGKLYDDPARMRTVKALVSEVVVLAKHNATMVSRAIEQAALLKTPTKKRR